MPQLPTQTAIPIQGPAAQATTAKGPASTAQSGLFECVGRLQGGGCRASGENGRHEGAHLWCCVQARACMLVCVVASAVLHSPVSQHWLTWCTASPDRYTGKCPRVCCVSHLGCVSVFDGDVSTKWLDFGGAGVGGNAWLEYRLEPGQVRR